MDGPDTKFICAAAMDLFRQEGLRFTMQQLAQKLHIHKKTLYTCYASKEALLLDMIDDAFGAIHARKQAILEENLPLEEKLRRVIIALPEEYAATNLAAENWRKNSPLRRSGSGCIWRPAGSRPWPFWRRPGRRDFCGMCLLMCFGP